MQCHTTRLAFCIPLPHPALPPLKIVTIVPRRGPVAFGMLLASASTLALAATALPETGVIPRPQPEASPGKSRQTDIQQMERPAYRAVDGAQNLQVRVKRFVFSGNRAFGTGQLQELLEGYMDRDSGLDALNEAAKTLTAFYRSRGYLLAQAYLPEQDIQNGVVEIAVLEGTLGRLTVSEAGQSNIDFLGKMAAYQLSPGDTITEKNLVRNLAVLNALPGLRASAQLAPGDLTGTSDADIRLQKLPSFSAHAGANNYGNRYTGREMALAGFNWYNPVDAGDHFYVNLKLARDSGQRGLNAGYLVPVHPSGTLLNVSYNYVDYRLGGQFEPLKATGVSQYVNFSLDQPWMRTAGYGLTARLGGAFKRVDDDVAAFSLNNRRDIANVDVGLSGEWTDSALDLTYQFGITLRGGRVSFRDSLAQSIDQTGPRTEGDFVRLGLQASRTQYFGHGYSLALRADYQIANKNLDSVEKMTIGGINRWRQYGELPSTVDNGLALGVQIRKHTSASLGSQPEGVFAEGVSPYAFFDISYGRVNQIALANENEVRSAHFGLGVDMSFRNGWQLNLSVSHQKREVAGAQEENETRVWVELQKGF